MIAILVVASLLAGAPPAWQITIDRPLKAGQKYRLDASGEQSMTMKDKDGKVLKTDRLTTTLKADVTVSKVDDRGIATELSVQVESLNMVVGERASKPIENERVVVTRTGPQETFVAGFGEITGPARKALRLAISVQPPGAPRSDDIFPAGKPRKLGDSWPMDAAKMATAMQGHGSDAKAEHIKGQAQLKGISPCGKETCLDLRFEFTVANVQPTSKPRGMKWIGANAKTIGTGLLPLDPRKQRLTETQEDWMTARVEVDGEKRTIEYHRTVSRKVTPL
ncbi:MAG: hypothetical protein ACI9WU_000467 [Myxococcota bacterium]|jgi:hypothetical protein